MIAAIGATYNVYSRGPRTDPCGTPNSQATVADCSWPTRTNWERPVTYEWTQRITEPDKPNVWPSRRSRVSWSIVSNAADRSSWISIVRSPLSAVQYTSFNIRNSAVSVE